MYMDNQTVTEESVLHNKTTDGIDDQGVFNIYPVIRHIFLTLCVLLTIAIILFLLYQNGKSIYDKGL